MPARRQLRSGESDRGRLCAPACARARSRYLWRKCDAILRSQGGGPAFPIMDLQLKDHVIVVTGGSKGIGAAIVRACVAEGAVPVIVNRPDAAGERLVAELRAAGATTHFIAGDLV